MGPEVELVASGTTIGPGKNYTVDQPIRLAFSRFLNPASVIRQAALLEDSSGNLITDPLVNYDPVLSTVTLSRPGSMEPWITEGQIYRIVLSVPTASFPFGVVALDGAPLAATATQAIVFTANPAATPPAAGEPGVEFCRDVLPIFNQKCSACHGLPGGGSYEPTDSYTLPREALILTTVDGIRATALGQVADESNTGPLAAPASYSVTTPFGIDMPVIAPADPGNSWLMYKVLMATPTPGVQDLDSGAPTFDDTAPSDLLADLQADRATLASYVFGNFMPYPIDPQPDAGPFYDPLTLHQLELVRAWIEQGAQFDQDPCP